MSTRRGKPTSVAVDGTPSGRASVRTRSARGRRHLSRGQHEARTRLSPSRDRPQHHQAAGRRTTRRDVRARCAPLACPTHAAVFHCGTRAITAPSSHGPLPATVATAELSRLFSGTLFRGRPAKRRSHARLIGTCLVSRLPCIITRSTITSRASSPTGTWRPLPRWERSW